MQKSLTVINKTNTGTKFIEKKFNVSTEKRKMLKKSEKFGSLFRSKQNIVVGDDATPAKGDASRVTQSRDDACARSSSFKIGGVTLSMSELTASRSKSVTSSASDLFRVASQSKCDEARVTQCYSVTTGKVSTLVRSPSTSTVSSHSSASFNGDGDDEAELFPGQNIKIASTLGSG